LAGLNLSNIRLGLLAENLKANTSLLGLHLCRKNLQDIDGEVLAQMLMDNTKLQKLELEGNKIGAVGIKPLAKALEDNYTLRFLDLESNPLTGLSKHDLISKDFSKQDNSGIKAIGSMLRSNKKLLVLNLANTGISVDGGDILVDAMETNTTLINLEIADNGLSVVQIRKIQEYLTENKKAYDKERLQEFKERKLMFDEDSSNKNLLDIEEKKKEESEIQQKNKQQRLTDREKRYADMVISVEII